MRSLYSIGVLCSTLPTVRFESRRMLKVPGPCPGENVDLPGIRPERGNARVQKLPRSWFVRIADQPLAGKQTDGQRFVVWTGIPCLQIPESISLEEKQTNTDMRLPAVPCTCRFGVLGLLAMFDARR